MRVSEVRLQFKEAFLESEHRAAQLVEDRRVGAPLGLALAAQRLLQREHALRPLEVIQAQAPVDDVEQLRRILRAPGLARRHVACPCPRAGWRLRRLAAGEAGVHRRADRIDVAPGPEQVAPEAVLLGRGVARACRSAAASSPSPESVWRAAPKSSSSGRAVVAQIDVRRLDVQVQQLVGVHLAQAVQELGEGRADPGFVERRRGCCGRCSCSVRPRS